MKTRCIRTMMSCIHVHMHAHIYMHMNTMHPSYLHMPLFDMILSIYIHAFGSLSSLWQLDHDLHNITMVTHFMLYHHSIQTCHLYMIFSCYHATTSSHTRILSFPKTEKQKKRTSFFMHYVQGSFLTFFMHFL